MPAKTPNAKIPNNPPQKTAPHAVPAVPPFPKLSRPLPAKSLKKAASAFKNFSPSRFKEGATPSNYVSPSQAKVPAAVHAVQRKSIAWRVTALAAAPPANPGMSVALPEALLTALLPSFDAAAGTVNLTELLGVLRQRMRGTEFYANGNPTLTRVVQDSQLLSQVQGFIEAIKTGVI